ncbi:MAG TPA: hypothetical protein DCQ31_02775 [Bacteroidales bacterium]|nr:hypothetical protein [Bacteroidales bacterium]
MSWLYLLLAGLFEMGWPIGFKLSQNDNFKFQGIALAIIFMALSGFFLWLAQKTIPIGTAYAVWTGIGAVGTLAVGIVFFGDSSNFWRLFSAMLIVLGIIGLKLTD